MRRLIEGFQCCVSFLRISDIVRFGIASSLININMIWLLMILLLLTPEFLSDGIDDDDCPHAMDPSNVCIAPPADSQ